MGYRFWSSRRLLSHPECFSTILSAPHSPPRLGLSHVECRIGWAYILHWTLLCA